MALVNVVVACTERKRLPVAARHRLRSIRGQDLDRRFEAWQRALESNGPGTTPALDLYSGDHWAVARELPMYVASRGWDLRLWVASAGYGLIPAEALVTPYSATFAPLHADSVVTAGASDWSDGIRYWWRLHASVPGPAPKGPRRIADLASGDEAIVVVASDTYVHAMEDDLLTARRSLSKPERLIIVSARSRRSTALASNWVETNARMRLALGGAMGSLNVRAARHFFDVLGPSELDVQSARAFGTKLLSSSPDLPVFNRTPSTDNQVFAFVRRSLLIDPFARHSPLLRQYRDSGRQCEQKRFRAIFEQVAKETE